MNQTTPSIQEQALSDNGGRPLVQTFTTRHPDTGETIADVKPWQDKAGNWLPTEFNAETGKYQIKKEQVTHGE